MRRIVPFICTVALLAFASLGLAQSVATDPVGFVTLTAKGTSGLPGGATNALSFQGLAFTQPVSYQATLSSASGTTLTDSNATWSDNQYNGATNNYYIELTTGTGAGRMSQIAATTAASKSVTTADDLSSFVTAGTGYKIRPNWTLSSLFGATNQAGLQGGTASSADQILVYNASTATYTTYYYQTSGLGGVGWRKAGDGTHADQSLAGFFKPTDGILIKRFQSADVSFSIAGAVKLGQTATPIAVGLNIVSNPYPSGTFTLGTNSNLYTGNTATGLAGGTASTADLVLIYDPVNAVYNSYYYQTSGLGGTGWRLAGDSTHGDKSGIAIPFGNSILIQRKAATAFTWVALQPFTYP